jgi:hypothetical protein
MKYHTRLVIIPVGPSIAYVPLTQEQFALIDSQDVHAVGKYDWCAHWDRRARCFYARRTSGRPGKTIYLHSEILNPSQGFLADHISCNSLYNRRANLREATVSQNVMNRGLPSTNTTGYKGVTKHKATGKYQASATVNGKYHYRGLHETPELAHIAASAARAELHGEFARTR